tara:strand:- start:701 stop:1132 length:432 start_codon:yes stop_codon:yes gene_type:complete
MECGENMDSIDLELMAEKKNLVCITNRCWNTAAKLIMSFPKSQRKQMTLVEGRMGKKDLWHFWIELDNGEIFDPHFWHFDLPMANESNSRAEKRWAGDTLVWAKGDENVEMREGSRWNERVECWADMKVFSCRDLDWDNMPTL